MSSGGAAATRTSLHFHISDNSIKTGLRDSEDDDQLFVRLGYEGYTFLDISTINGKTLQIMTKPYHSLQKVHTSMDDILDHLARNGYIASKERKRRLITATLQEALERKRQHYIASDETRINALKSESIATRLSAKQLFKGIKTITVPESEELYLLNVIRRFDIERIQEMARARNMLRRVISRRRETTKLSKMVTDLSLEGGGGGLAKTEGSLSKISYASMVLSRTPPPLSRLSETGHRFSTLNEYKSIPGKDALFYGLGRKHMWKPRVQSSINLIRSGEPLSRQARNEALTILQLDFEDRLTHQNWLQSTGQKFGNEGHVQRMQGLIDVFELGHDPGTDYHVTKLQQMTDQLTILRDTPGRDLPPSGT